MLSEEAIVSKAYDDINKRLTAIHEHFTKTKTDDEIIASYMECIDHHDAEWLSGLLHHMGSVVQMLDMIEVSQALRDNNLETLVIRYLEIIP